MSHSRVAVGLRIHVTMTWHTSCSRLASLSKYFCDPNRRDALTMTCCICAHLGDRVFTRHHAVVRKLIDRQFSLFQGNGTHLPRMLLFTTIPYHYGPAMEVARHHGIATPTTSRVLVWDVHASENCRLVEGRYILSRHWEYQTSSSPASQDQKDRLIQNCPKNEPSIPKNRSILRCEKRSETEEGPIINVCPELYYLPHWREDGVEGWKLSDRIYNTVNKALRPNRPWIHANLSR